MAQEKPNRMAELMTLLFKNAPIAKDHAKKWIAVVREEPQLIWESRVIRYAAYGVGAIVLTWGLTFAIRLLTPPAPPGARSAAITADYHVVCNDPGCAYNFVISREFGFDRFPVPCDRCKKETGVPGRRCHSAQCQGRWVAPRTAGDRQECPLCGTAFAQ